MSFINFIIPLVISQCAIDLAKSLNASNNVIPEMTKNCCNPTGIVCNPKNNVIEINWRNMAFIGTINAATLPSTLIKLDLESNKITGNLPTEWPSTLTSLYLGNNSIGGGVGKLPVALKVMDISRNRITGSFPLDLPLSLTTIYVNGNMMTGTVPFLPSIVSIHLGYTNSTGNSFSGVLHLSSATELNINGNEFTDVILDNLDPLKTCDISGNLMLNSPHLSNFTNCAKNGLKAPKLSDIPVPSPSPSKSPSPLPSLSTIQTPIISPSTIQAPMTSPSNANPTVSRTSLPTSTPTSIASPTPAVNSNQNPTTIQTKEAPQVQTSANSSSEAKPLTSSTIMLIVAGIVFLLVLPITIYCLKKTSAKKKNDFTNFTFEYENGPVVELENQFYQQPAFEPVTPHSIKTNSAFHSNYYYGDTPANVV